MMLRRPERYQALLRVRKREEDRRAAALSRAANDVQSTERDIVSLRTQHAKTLQRARTAMTAPRAQELTRFADYETFIVQQIAKKNDELAERVAVQAECQREFETSHVQRRIVDRLIERAETALADWRDREERKLSEDLTSMRYARTRRHEEAAR